MYFFLQISPIWDLRMQKDTHIHLHTISMSQFFCLCILALSLFFICISIKHTHTISLSTYFFLSISLSVFLSRTHTHTAKDRFVQRFCGHTPSQKVCLCVVEALKLISGLNPPQSYFSSFFQRKTKVKQFFWNCPHFYILLNEKRVHNFAKF